MVKQYEETNVEVVWCTSDMLGRVYRTLQPMATITEKSFSENISIHTAVNIETIISASP